LVILRKRPCHLTNKASDLFSDFGMPLCQEKVARSLPATFYFLARLDQPCGAAVRAQFLVEEILRRRLDADTGVRGLTALTCAIDAVLL